MLLHFKHRNFNASILQKCFSVRNEALCYLDLYIQAYTFESSVQQVHSDLCVLPCAVKNRKTLSSVLLSLVRGSNAEMHVDRFACIIVFLSISPTFSCFHTKDGGKSNFRFKGLCIFLFVYFLFCVQSCLVTCLVVGPM